MTNLGDRLVPGFALRLWAFAEMRAHFLLDLVETMVVIKTRRNLRGVEMEMSSDVIERTNIPALAVTMFTAVKLL